MLGGDWAEIVGIATTSPFWRRGSNAIAIMSGVASDGPIEVGAIDRTSSRRGLSRNVGTTSIIDFEI